MVNALLAEVCTLSVFLMRSAMHSADNAVARRLSVHLYVTRRYSLFCRNVYTYPQIFSPSGSHTILVFQRLTLR